MRTVLANSRFDSPLMNSLLYGNKFHREGQPDVLSKKITVLPLDTNELSFTKNS